MVRPDSFQLLFLGSWKILKIIASSMFWGVPLLRFFAKSFVWVLKKGSLLEHDAYLWNLRWAPPKGITFSVVFPISSLYSFGLLVSLSYECLLSIFLTTSVISAQRFASAPTHKAAKSSVLLWSVFYSLDFNIGISFILLSFKWPIMPLCSLWGWMESVCLQTRASSSASLDKEDAVIVFSCRFESKHLLSSRSL